MLTIEELISGQADAISAASQKWDETTLETIRQGPEGQTAYDILLAQMDAETKNEIIN